MCVGVFLNLTPCILHNIRTYILQQQTSEKEIFNDQKNLPNLKCFLINFLLAACFI